MQLSFNQPKRGFIKESSTETKGFTLVELLVVIAIIGVLAALVVANFNAARERARDTQRKSDLSQIKKALRLYYNDNNVYPNTLTFGVIFQSVGNVVYMKLIPHDPQYDPTDIDPIEYTYQMNDPNSQDFCLWAHLENTADSDIGGSQARCSVCGVSDPTTDYVVCAD